MRSSWQRNIVCALSLVVMLVVSLSVAAKEKGYTKGNKEARSQTTKAARVFTEIMSIPDKAIPKELLDKAEAVAVFPGVIKAGVLIVGGRGGRGVISRRTANGWGAPAFFNLGGGSFGPQIGASSTDFVLLFMNEGAVQGLLTDKFEIGGEGSVAAGPIGRAASASTDVLLRAGILSYSRSKGLFAGLELKGVIITPDNDLNEAVYGQKARDILLGSQQMMASAPRRRKKGTSLMPQSVRTFPLTLARYSNRSA